MDQIAFSDLKARRSAGLRPDLSNLQVRSMVAMFLLMWLP